MNRKIIGSIEPKCEYCKIGKISADNNKVLCPKKGVMNKDFFCKKFRYDPLKRVPEEKMPELMKFTPEDFSL